MCLKFRKCQTMGSKWKLFFSTGLVSIDDIVVIELSRNILLSNQKKLCLILLKARKYFACDGSTFDCNTDIYSLYQVLNNNYFDLTQNDKTIWCCYDVRWYGLFILFHTGSPKSPWRNTITKAGMELQVQVCVLSYFNIEWLCRSVQDCMFSDN